MTTTQKHSIKKFGAFADEQELQKYLEVNFCESLKQMIKVVIKTMIRTEMENFRKEIEEKLVFNGYYGRNLVSTYGRIEDVPVPRFRENVEGMELNSLRVFSEEEQKLIKLIEQMHLLGISNRKISYLAKEFLKVPISKDKSSAIFKELADKEEVNINSQTIVDEYAYVILDGIWEKSKGYGWENNKSVMLAALGIKRDGSCKIIGFKVARGEDSASWGELLKSLKNRGLKNLTIIIADDGAGLKSALSAYYPTVPLQVCITHKMRNTFARASVKNKKAIGADVSTVFKASSKEEAIKFSKAFVKKWYMIEPKAVESFKFNLEYCFTYFDFPKEEWSHIRTSNILEREFREVRRRIKVFDNSFNSIDSTNRYGNQIFTYLNNNYPAHAIHTNS